MLRVIMCMAKHSLAVFLAYFELFYVYETNVLAFLCVCIVHLV